MTAKELIHELPKGLIKWHGFTEGGQALYITAGTDLDLALAEALSESGLQTECRSMAEVEGLGSGRYDYVLMADALIYAKEEEAEEFLKLARTALKENGRLFLCVENRFGIRYFCGDQDPFTGRNFDSIENYRRISALDENELAGKLYARAELTTMLESAGFAYHKFYSVFPELTCPQILFAEDCVPAEELKIRIFPQYRNPDTVFLEEENLYTPLIQNGMFHTMANGFVIECPLDGNYANVSQITVSMERGRKNALHTLIRNDGKVEKRPAYREGSGKVEQLMDNNRYLQRHGVKMIGAEVVGDSFVMPYIDGLPLAKYFRMLAGRDREAFYRQFDRLLALILSSSEHIPYEKIDWEHFNPLWDEVKKEKDREKIDRRKWRRIAFGSKEERSSLGPVLERGYIDLVLINGFAVDDDFVFYDQELYVEHLPAKAVMLRNIDFLYHGDAQMEQIVPKKELLARYDMEMCLEIYYSYINHFLTRLRNDDILQGFHESRRRNDGIVHSNRQRMNYSAAEYQRLFVDIFRNLDNRRVYLFGSGSFAKKFLALYKEEYDIAGILDNDASRWGGSVEDIEIMPPSVLQGMDASTYKVMICIKNHTGVLRQVKKLGATNISIYDTNMEYPRERKTVAVPSGHPAEKKRYHVGYVAGVFDLFHIGHLNLLRRSKEQCDHLIVGVVTDEGVRRYKDTESFIPFEERLAIVASCRYVDEAVGIPLEYCDTKDAYLKFQFDVQFSGSDYIDDEVWKRKREFLREHGAELVFFPYTESTSSTRIKEMIDRKLM